MTEQFPVQEMISLVDAAAVEYNNDKTIAPINKRSTQVGCYELHHYQSESYLMAVSFREVPKFRYAMSHYFGAIEIDHVPSYGHFNILIRMEHYCVIYQSANNTFWYKDNLEHIDKANLGIIYSIQNVIEISDLDKYNLFQFRLMNENADNIFNIKTFIEKMLSDDFYSELINSALRPY